MRLTRRYPFAASHRLHSPELSEQQNRQIYGKCNNPFGHGHNYVLEVSVRGPVDEETGRAVDIAALDELVRRMVVKAFDHRNLNTEVSEFASISPTTENVAIEIERRLKAAWPAAFVSGRPQLEKIRLYETRKNIFEVDTN